MGGGREMDRSDRRGAEGAEDPVEAWAREVGRRVAAEVREEVTAEIRDLLRTRLIDAALRELAIDPDAPGDTLPPPSDLRAGPSGGIDQTIRALGTLADTGRTPAVDAPPVTGIAEGLYAYGICSS